jgi:hypothetical protein
MYERGISRCFQRLIPLGSSDREGAGEKEECLIQPSTYLAG